MNIITYITAEDLKGRERSFKILADVSPIIPGVFHRAPEDCYPDEGGEIEILSVWEITSNVLQDVELNVESFIKNVSSFLSEETINREIMEQLQTEEEWAICDEADRKWEGQRDDGYYDKWED